MLLLGLAHGLQPTALRLVDDPPPAAQDEAPAAWGGVPDQPLASPADGEPALESDQPVVDRAPAADMPTAVRASGGGMIPWWVALIAGLGGFAAGIFTCYLCFALIVTSYFY